MKLKDLQVNQALIFLHRELDNVEHQLSKLPEQVDANIAEQAANDMEFSCQLSNAILIIESYAPKMLELLKHTENVVKDLYQWAEKTNDVHSMDSMKKADELLTEINNLLNS